MGEVQSKDKLASVCVFARSSKRRILMKIFISPQYAAFSFVWMFHARREKLMEPMKKPNELFMIRFFISKLEKDECVIIDHPNLPVVATEFYKVTISVAPECSLPFEIRG